MPPVDADDALAGGSFNLSNGVGEMGMKKYRFVGSAVDYWLPDDITVEIAIVPASVTNVRSNQFSLDQTTVTIHETANYNAGANADMHKRWLHSGASGSYVGFNFVVDDKKIIQLTPLNEVTWAAGTPAGNRTSWHIESCVNSDADLGKTRRNTAALAGSILAAQGWAIAAMVQHNVWFGKNCPAIMRRDGLWPQFVNMSSAARSASVAAAKGGDNPAPTPEPEPLAPVATIRFEVPFRTSPGFWDYDANKSNVNSKRPTLPAGTRGEVIDGPREAEGITWYDIRLDSGETGWVQDEILHALSID